MHSRQAQKPSLFLLTVLFLITAQVFTGCRQGDGAENSEVILRGTAVPVSIQGTAGERIPVRIDLPEEQDTYWIRWEVQPASLGTVWYVNTDPSDIKYDPEGLAEPDCGPKCARQPGRYAVFLPARAGEGTLKVTAYPPKMTRESFLTTYYTPQLLAQIPLDIDYGTPEEAPCPQHLLLYRTGEGWVLEDNGKRQVIEGEFEYLSISPGGRWLAGAEAVNGGFGVRIMERNGQADLVHFSLPVSVHTLAWSYTGMALAVVGEDGIVRLIDLLDPKQVRQLNLPTQQFPYSISWAWSSRLDYHTLTEVWHLFKDHPDAAKPQSAEKYLGPGLPLTPQDAIVLRPRNEASFVYTRPVMEGNKSEVRHVLLLRDSEGINEIGSPSFSYAQPVWSPDGAWLYASATRLNSGETLLMRYDLARKVWTETGRDVDRLSVATVPTLTRE